MTAATSNSNSNSSSIARTAVGLVTAAWLCSWTLLLLLLLPRRLGVQLRHVLLLPIRP
jgi:hypothetical protein